MWTGFQAGSRADCADDRAERRGTGEANRNRVSKCDDIKQPDKITFTFDPTAKTIRSYTVDTYEDKPIDVVTIAVNFASLQDGPNYAQQTVLNSKSKQIQVKTTNSGYRTFEAMTS